MFMLMRAARSATTLPCVGGFGLQVGAPKSSFREKGASGSFQIPVTPTVPIFGAMKATNLSPHVGAILG